MLRDLRIALSWLDARQLRRWRVLAPLMVLSAAVEAVGALAVFGLLRLVVDPSRVQSTPVVSQIAAIWPGGDPAGVIAFLTVFVGVFYAVRGALLASVEWLRERAVHESAAFVADRLYGRYLAAPYAFHVRRQSAALIDQIGRTAELAYQLGVAPAHHLLAEGLTAAALVAVLVINAPPIALSAVGLVLAAVALMVWLTRRRWARLGVDERALAVAELHGLQQSLTGIKDVIVTGRRGFFEDRLRRTRRSLARLKERRMWLTSVLRIGVETGLVLAMLLVIFLVMRRGIPGADTIAVLALFAYTGFRLVPAANRAMLNIGYLREGAAAIEAIARDFETLPAPPARQGLETQVTFAESLELLHVSFAHEAGHASALRDVTLAIRRGESVGIVGPTGAGKSTLVDLILGVRTPTEGRLLVDGEPIAGHEPAWQRLIGYVPQTVFLLDDSLRRNIAFGEPDRHIDEERIAAVVAQARLDDLAARLPQGLDTTVGENGVRLSGGERQRVAIARALYRDPLVLIFDEATAALDAQTEREVTAAIAALHGTRTLIAIAHRLSTVRDCDRVILLRDGRVEAQGTFDDLMRHAAFRELS